MKPTIPIFLFTILWFHSNAQLKMRISIARDEKIVTALNGSNIDTASGILFPNSLLGTINSIVVDNQSQSDFLFGAFDSQGITAFVVFTVAANKKDSVSFDQVGKCINRNCNASIQTPMLIRLSNQTRNTGLVNILIKSDSSGNTNRALTTGQNNDLRKIAYYDANTLKALFSSSAPDYNVTRKILQYYNKQNTSSDPAVIMAAYKDNPFLSAIVDSLIKKRKGITDISTKIPFPQNILTSLGGLDVTNIANGIGQLMIKRAKAELTISFFDKFEKFAKKNPEFQILFPKTTDNLANLLSYKYPEMLSALRKSFFDDLNTITLHFDDVLALPRYQELLRNFPEIRVVIRSIRLIHEIQSGDSHPADVISKFAALPEWTESSTSHSFRNFGSTIKLAAIFSGSLRYDTSVNHDQPRGWVSAKQLDTLITNDTLFKIYMGLVYQLVKDSAIRFYDKDLHAQPFDSTIASHKADLFIFQNKVTRFIELADKVDKTLDTLKEKKGHHIQLTNDDYYNYVDISLDIIDYGFSIANIFNDKINAGEYISVAREGNDLYRNIYRQEYVQAITNAMDIFDHIRDMVNENKASLLKAIKDSSSIELGKSKSLFGGKPSFNHTSKKDAAKLDAELSKKTNILSKADSLNLSKAKALIESGTMDKFGEVMADVRKYGLVMANIVTAKTAQEVEDALDNAILPVGSSSIKKNSTLNVSVQSYLGAYARIGSLANSDVNSTWSNKFGVAAPIGFAVSTGIGKAGSLSLFLPVFDLSAIVDYQLKKDTVVNNGVDTALVSKNYQIKLGQIFSPGVFFVYGAPINIPLSLGVGAQYGPGLGKIDKGGGALVSNPQWRWSIFLSVDLPFFNLYNHTKRYKK